MLVKEGVELSDEELLAEYNGDIINQWHHLIPFEKYKELRKNFSSSNYGKTNTRSSESIGL